MTLPDRVALFRDDIGDSAGALAALLDGWRRVDLGDRTRVVTYGLGSSRYAGLVATAAARAAGRQAWTEYAGTTAPPPPADDLVAVCISASGRTPEVLRMADRHRGRSRVVAITNDTASPLAAAADVVVPLAAGRERAGISCRTYRATLVALGLLLDVVRPEEVRQWVDVVTEDGTDADPWVDATAAALDGAPAIDVVADQALLGAAGQAALMLREAPRLSAHAVESADWGHTHVYLALPGHRVLRFEGSPEDAAVAGIVERRGGTTVTVPTGGGGPLREAVVGSVAVERLAVELWDRTIADGDG